MFIQDPIADLCTRIRNAVIARRYTLTVPASKMKRAIIQVMKEEGYIHHYKFTEDGKQGILTIYLAQVPAGGFVLREIKTVSKPGLRVYVKRSGIPLVKRGLGIAVLSTSMGIMTGREAFRKGVGGEHLLSVF